MLAERILLYVDLGVVSLYILLYSKSDSKRRVSNK